MLSWWTSCGKDIIRWSSTWSFCHKTHDSHAIYEGWLFRKPISAAGSGRTISGINWSQSLHRIDPENHRIAMRPWWNIYVERSFQEYQDDDLTPLESAGDIYQYTHCMITNCSLISDAACLFFSVEGRSSNHEPCQLTHSPHYMEPYMDHYTLALCWRQVFTVSHVCKRECHLF